MLLWLLVAASTGRALAAAERKAKGEESAGQLRSKADEALVTGKTDEAISLLAKVIALEPDNERNYFKRARALQRAKQPLRAIDDLGAALRLKPDYDAARTARARALLSVGSCAEAADDYRAGIAGATKDSARADATKGLSLADGCVAALAAASKARARGDRRLELEHLAEVLEKYADAQPAPLLLRRARAHFDRGDFYEAIAESGKALKQAPDDLEALELRGAAYYRLADHAMAKTHWQQALRSDPEHPGCKAGYKTLRSLTKKDAAGDKAAAAGDHAAAVDHWAAAADVDATHGVFRGQARMKMASSYLELKDYAGAAKTCEAVLADDGGHVDALLKLTEAQIGAELFDLASRTAARAREVADDDRTRRNQQRAETALKQSKEINYYKVLGVARDANSKEIKKAYRGFALEYHPDKIPPDASDEERERLTTKFQEVAAAYEILSDDETRAKYDAGEDVSGQANQGGGQQGFPGGFPFPGGGFPGGFPGGGGGGQRFHFQFR